MKQGEVRRREHKDETTKMRMRRCLGSFRAGDIAQHLSRIISTSVSFENEMDRVASPAFIRRTSQYILLAHVYWYHTTTVEWTWSGQFFQTLWTLSCDFAVVEGLCEFLRVSCFVRKSAFISSVGVYFGSMTPFSFMSRM